MKFTEKSIEGLFGQAKISFEIPEYQRAYSWEDDQLNEFLEDLYEHRNSGESNPYCYGNILVETMGGNKYNIIDGQQRLTTIMIFVRAILNVLKTKKVRFDYNSEERIFFKDYGVIKLRPVDYDRKCFDVIVINNKDGYVINTLSQKRMLDAKNFFIKELSKFGGAELKKIYDTLKNSIVNFIELNGKKESALMFELQNNRGKELTNLEKIKSYLMYQLYIWSDASEVETNIEYVANAFNPIYVAVKNIKDFIVDDDNNGDKSALDEDNILNYHSYAYHKKNFNYRSVSDIISEFKEIKDNQKVQWIKSYIDELQTTFSNIEKLQKIKDVYLNKIKRLKFPYIAYPFIIKGLKYYDVKGKELQKLFEILEVLCFRYKLINSRSDIRGRLNDVIKSFDGNIKELRDSIKNAMEEAYYWSDDNQNKILNGNMYKNGVVNYLLWEYEESLQMKGYKFGDISIEGESIEHISPQTEPEENVSAGYEIGDDNKYSLDFRNLYLNKLGNLVIISRSHNSHIGNNPFKDKLESFINNPLLKQQSEINVFVDEKEIVWKMAEIDKRHEKIVEFANNRWSYDKIELK